MYVSNHDTQLYLLPLILGTRHDKCLLESKNKCLTTTDDHAKFSLIGQHSATSELTVTVQVAMIVRVSAESL